MCDCTCHDRQHKGIVFYFCLEGIALLYPQSYSKFIIFPNCGNLQYRFDLGFSCEFFRILPSLNVSHLPLDVILTYDGTVSDTILICNPQSTLLSSWAHFISCSLPESFWTSARQGSGTCLASQVSYMFAGIWKIQLRQLLYRYPDVLRESITTQKITWNISEFVNAKFTFLYTTFNSVGKGIRDPVWGWDEKKLLSAASECWLAMCQWSICLGSTIIILPWFMFPRKLSINTATALIILHCCGTVRTKIP